MGACNACPLGNIISCMKLKIWLSEGRGRVMRLAEHLGVVPSFVCKMAAGDKAVPIEHGAAIELFTDGAFSRKDYWPDTYWRIWPELADSAPNNPPALTTQAQAATESVAQGVAHA